MKTQKQFMIVLGLVVVSLFASCKKDNGESNNIYDGQGFSATTEQVGGNDTRSHINPESWSDGASASVLWTAGDQILVANHGGAEGCSSLTFSIAEGEDSTEGTFYFRGDKTDFFEPDYAVIYPAKNSENVANSIATEEGVLKATFNLPATQTYKANSFGEKAMPMVAYSADQTLTFKNVLGGICFSMVGGGAKVTRLVLTSEGDEALWGTCTTTIDTDGGDPESVVSNNATSKNVITLDCSANGGVTLSNNPTYFCFVVPVGSLAQGFSLEAFSEGTSVFSGSIASSPGITRNTIKKAANDITVEQQSHEKAFSVAEGRYVWFSPGNLVATLTNGGTTVTWSFAEHQWDYIGFDNIISAGTNGQMDLFGWSGDENSNYGVCFVADPNLYRGNFQDWGSNPDLINTLGNGWRTLTWYEWQYLLSMDPSNTARYGQFAVGKVHDVNGLIILPDVDVWSLPDGVPAFKNYFECQYTGYETNVYTDEQWALMEEAGAAFLPAVGERGDEVYRSGFEGWYWTGSLLTYEEMLELQEDGDKGGGPHLSDVGLYAWDLYLRGELDDHGDFDGDFDYYRYLNRGNAVRLVR